MKHILTFAAAALLLAACSGKQQERTSSATSRETVSKETTAAPEAKKGADVTTWSGNINGKIPVFMAYTRKENVLSGQIVYLNTKGRQPIRIIGTIDETGDYRILEFEASGNITGIISGKPDGKVFNGTWFSPKTRKDLPMALSAKDTTVTSEDFEADIRTAAGSYRYEYSEEGPQGGLTLEKLSDGKWTFSVSAVTGAPARNIADIGTDTITFSGNSFKYKVPDSDSCEFSVRIFKDFVIVKELHDFEACMGMFGHNATIEGVFLK